MRQTRVQRFEVNQLGHVRSKVRCTGVEMNTNGMFVDPNSSRADDSIRVDQEMARKIRELLCLSKNYAEFKYET